MNTNHLRHALLAAPIHELEEVIDWLDRPWARQRNHTLRSAFHEARRGEGRGEGRGGSARRALVFAIEAEVLGLYAERDRAHVAHRLGLYTTSLSSITTAMVQRLDGSAVVTDLLRATAGLARIFLGGARPFGR